MFIEERPSRQKLPRPQVSGVVYFVTLRLANSLDPDVVNRIYTARKRWLLHFAIRGLNPADRLPVAHKLLFSKLDDLLDRSTDDQLISRVDVATSVRDALQSLDGTKYQLISYCLMPNHVHALLRMDRSVEAHETTLGEQPDTDSPLADVLTTWKRETAERTGIAWHPLSFLQRVRDYDELERIIDYVDYNPVKAGLCARVLDWPWCSAREDYPSKAFDFPFDNSIKK